MDSGCFVYFVQTIDVGNLTTMRFSMEKRACSQRRTYPVRFPERVARPCGERFGENVSGAQKTHISERFNGSANNVLLCIGRVFFFLNFFSHTNRRKISRRLRENIAANSAKPCAVPVRGF